MSHFTGLGRILQAEEYLSQAQWTVLKTVDCPDSMKSRLYRNLGMLYAAKQQYDEALRNLANDVRKIIREFDFAEASSNKEWNTCFRCTLRRKSLGRAILRRQVVTSTWLTSSSAKTSTTSQTHFMIRFRSFHSRHNNHNLPVTNALLYFRIRWRQSGTTTCRVWSALAFKLRRHLKRFSASTIRSTKHLVRKRGGHILSYVC